jgi:hypothetical protein
MLSTVRNAPTICIAVLLSACGAGAGSSIATDEVTASALATTKASSTSSTSAPTVVASSTTAAAGWAGPCGRPGPAPQSYDHVIWIWMENKNLSAVLDSTNAPFMSGLAESCGTALQYVDHGVRPSLPNYIAATSGDIQGVHDDAFPSEHPLNVDNIFRQVRRVGKTAKSYEEAMPSNCALRSTSRYAVKHNPAAYYVSDEDRSACEHDDVAFDQFLPDLAVGLPNFSLITPDICNDMHDCPVATGDQWLQTVVPAITSSSTYRDGGTAVFIVFDESQGDERMPFIAIAPPIVPGTRAEAEIDHYSLLAFTEDAFGITTRLGKAADASSLADAFGL